MRILKIFDSDYPWDVRVEKITRTLVENGHEVRLVARNRHRRPRRELSEGIELWRLPCPGRLEPAVGFPAFFHPIWIAETIRALRGWSPDRILVRDLPLAPLGLALGRLARCPVVIDMAEPYPLALRSNWQFDAMGGIDYLIRSPTLAEAVERWVVRREPRVLAVSEEAGERLEALGLSPERWTLVGNTPRLDSLGLPIVDAGAIPEPRTLLFTGILVGDRGVEVAIEGLAELLRTDHAFRLVIVGDGPARTRYEARAAALGLGAHVHFAGFVPHEELPRYWRSASVGILPFHRCPHIDTTLANKLFDYMAMGLPVLASDAVPMRRILAETGAGLCFRSGDPKGFAEAALAISSDREAAARFGRAGRAAAEQKYSWPHDARRLLAALESP